MTALAFFAQSAQAEVVVNQSVQMNLEVFVPCANQGAGELVRLSGPLHVLITFTANGKTFSGSTQFQLQGISGIGVDSGERYNGTGSTQDHFSGTFIKGQSSASFINNAGSSARNQPTTSCFTKTSTSPSTRTECSRPRTTTSA